MHKIVILGGGFGGLYTAKALRNVKAAVTVIDRRNYHLFQPLLYQVATGALSPANIAAPLRSVLRRHHNTVVWLGQVGDIDPHARRVILADGDAVAYDSLVIATGARHDYFGNDAWEPHAPGLKTVEEAILIRSRIFHALEEAERHPEAAGLGLLTMVVVGGGPTGVEMAGSIAEILKHAVPNEFRHIAAADSRVVLVEAGTRLLPAFDPALSARARSDLERLGVEVRTQTRVTGVNADAVSLALENGELLQLPCKTVVWAAGVRASRLGQVLAARCGAQLDRAGRVMVQPDLTLAGHPEIFVIGDLAHCVQGATGQPLPGIAPVAIQQGRYVARALRQRVAQELTAPTPATPTSHAAATPPAPSPSPSPSPRRPFRYRHRGALATIGRAAAVVDLGFFRAGGVVAWLLWLFVHLMYIVQFGNRVLVFIQWTWAYLTFGRAARLITGEPAAVKAQSNRATPTP